jgi:predicted acylesterase/phospholipase RssA
VPPAAKKKRGRPRIGLALAGGGPVGAVYEIGALRALDEVLDGIDFSALDMYVGVSAGSLIASLLVNGFTPAHLVRILAEQERDDPLLPSVFFTPAYREWLGRAARVPWLLAEVAWSLSQRRNIFRAASRLAPAIPAALFDNEPIRRSLRAAFSRTGRTDDFRRLERRLIVVATDLAAGVPLRFGEPGLDDVPISRAVQASTALPGLYPPVSINGRHCVDGVLLKTVHASVAFEAGMDLVFCVNPIVPVDTSAGVNAGALPPGSLLAGGLPTLLSQTFRTLIHSRLQAGFSAYGERYPESAFVLFEPDRDEYDMFFSNVFSLSSRRAVCELAYRATRRDLRRRARTLEPALRRGGITLRRDVLDDETRDVWEGVGVARAPSHRPGRGSVAVRLGKALDGLAGQAGYPG